MVDYEYADWINSVGKVWVVAFTFLGVASVAYPFGTSVSGASVAPPVWLWIVEAVLLFGYGSAVLLSFLDRKFWDQHVRTTKYDKWHGMRLFLPYVAMLGALCAGIGFYVHLLWYINNSDVRTLADLTAASGYISSGFTAGCAVSIAMRAITTTAFFVMLFSDAGTRNNADQIRRLRKSRPSERA